MSGTDEGEKNAVEKVCAFLRDRGVEEEVVKRFRSEKMDAPAVLSAPEGLLEQLGLSKAGDRLNLVAYCKTTHEKPNESQQKKKALLEAFLSRKKMKKSHKTKELTSVEKKKEKIKNKKVQLGWKHFREEDDAYVLVPLSKGGGSRTVDVPVTISRFELHQMCKSLFFPDGQSLFGKADDMLLDLANFKDEKISDTITVGADCTVPFNVANYMEAHKIKTVRLYLRSKLLTTDSDDDDLYHSPFDIREVMPPVELNEGSSLIGSSEDRKALKEEQDEAYRVSLLTDEKGCADLERKIHDEKRKERLQRARMERVLPEPSSDFVTVKIRHPSLGLQSRKFPTHTLMNSVYDWAGSLATEPEHFTLNDPLGKMLLPISELDDRCTLTMIESQEGTPSLLSSDDEVDFLGFGPAVDTSEFSGWLTEFDEPDIQGSRDAQYSVSHASARQENLQQTQAPSISSASAISDSSAQPQPPSMSIRFIRIRRVQIMSDMIEVFKDRSVMEARVKVTMINAHGQEEAGSDENGVFRDALSAFWSAFENSCTVGEDERIPVIRHDYQCPEWEAIARILVKGFYQLNFFPAKLNQAFIIATLFGENEVSQKVLLNSFLSYLSRDERALVENALRHSLNDEQSKEWLDFLDRFGCKRVPTPEQIRDTILEIAHKEQIQASQYIIDCWHEPCRSLKTVIFNVSELVNVLSRAIPTNKKVIDLLEVIPEPQNNGQREAISYFKRYLRGLDTERLMKVLRFLTGATVICVDKIKVTFTSLDGFERRPIAHTCEPSLELPSTYRNFPEFRQEMNNILDSEFWEMDIA